MSLSKKSTLEEVFEFVKNDEHDVQVIPVTLSKPKDDFARLMILIQGTSATANTIMANLMTAVQEMHDLAAQKDADDAPKLVGSDGKLLNDDGPALLVPKTDG